MHSILNTELRMLKKLLVAVGDKKCGKTALLVRIEKKIFMEEYTPTIFENYASEIEISQGVVQVSMYDTPGDDNFSHLRPLSYPNSDLLLLCFDMSDTTSYRNIFIKWLPEVRNYCPNAKVYIIGCKKDLQTKKSEKTTADWRKIPPNNKEEVDRLLFGSGVNAYFECSAKSGENVNEILTHYAKSIEGIVPVKTRRKSFIHTPIKDKTPNSKIRRHSIAEIRMTEKLPSQNQVTETKKSCSFL